MLIKNDISIPKVSSRMVARICDLQRKQKHHHKAKTVLPRAVPFWASAKTISMRDICGESMAERDDETVQDFEEVPTVRSKFSILGKLDEWDLSKLKSDYSNHEAEMASLLSDRLSRATEFNVTVQKIVPSRVVREPRPPLVHSKHIVPSFKRRGKYDNTARNIAKRDSASTLAELEVYIEQSASDNYMYKELDDEIEDDQGQAYGNDYAEEFLGKRSIQFARDIHTSASLSTVTASYGQLLDEDTMVFETFQLDKMPVKSGTSSTVKSFVTGPFKKSRLIKHF